MLEITNLRHAGKPLADPELKVIDAWWRAANYLSVGQIYLLDNPLLREPLAIGHIKPRSLLKIISGRSYDVIRTELVW